MDTDRLLADVLHFAQECLTHGDVESACDLAGSVTLLDQLLRQGAPLPAAWAES